MGFSDLRARLRYVYMMRTVGGVMSGGWRIEIV
jgi:hypothetical protein